jgi:tetratricopeptide (TPR) repeat protein
VKQEKWTEALQQYERAIGGLHSAGCDENPPPAGMPMFLFGKAAAPATRQLLLSCHTNSALCALKLEEYQVCIEHCTAALEMDRNPKALFRRGRAYLKLCQFDLAKKDLMACRKLAPSSKDIHRVLLELKAAKEIKFAAKSSNVPDEPIPCPIAAPITFVSVGGPSPFSSGEAIDIGTLTFSVEHVGKAFRKDRETDGPLVELTEEEMLAPAACKDGWSSESVPRALKDKFTLLAFTEYDRPEYISRKDWETDGYTGYKGVQLGPQCCWSPELHSHFPDDVKSLAVTTALCLKRGSVPSVATNNILSFACKAFVFDNDNTLVLEEGSVRNDSMFGSAAQEEWCSKNGHFTIRDITTILTSRFKNPNPHATGPRKAFVWGMHHLEPAHRREKYQKFSWFNRDDATFSAGMHLVRGDC